MKNEPQNIEEPLSQKSASGGCLKIFGVVVFASVLTAVLVVVGIKMFIFPGEFRPV